MIGHAISKISYYVNERHHALLTPFLEEVGYYGHRIRSYRYERYIAHAKKAQKDRFEHLKGMFSKHLADLAGNSVGSLSTPLWDREIVKIMRAFSPTPPFSFLRKRIIRKDLFNAVAGWPLSYMISHLETNYLPRQLVSLLQEDYVGMPLILNRKYMTSSTMVVHLYHLSRFQEATGVSPRSVGVVIEWGGGYGDMAKVLKRINPSVTYLIIDLPKMICIQWLYLSSIHGPDHVNIMKDARSHIESGKINLLPVTLLQAYADNLSKLDADLFIATFSLSESSRFAQDLVDSFNFFNCKHLLLGTSDMKDPLLSDPAHLVDMVTKRGAKMEPLKWIPSYSYALF